MSAGDELGVGQRGGPDRAVDQARDQALQLEAAVVAPGEAREVAPRVLRADPAVGAGDRRLDVAERGVDPPERRPARRPLAAAGHHGGVLEAGLGRRGPAAQPVGDQAAGRGQVLGHELPDLLLAEAFHRQQLDLARAAVVARRHRRHERLLAGGTPAPPPRTVPAEVGVVHLDPAVQPLPPLPLGHDAHDLLLQRPSVRLLDAETPAQLDRADAVLGGGDQPHRQEPAGERQLGGVEDRAGGERDLVAAGAALDLGPGAEPLALARAAQRADEALRPAQLLDRRPAPILGAVGLPELRLAQALDPRRQLARHSAPPARTKPLKDLARRRCLPRLIRFYYARVCFPRRVAGRERVGYRARSP